MLEKLLEVLVEEYGIDKVQDTLDLISKDWVNATVDIDRRIIELGWRVSKLNRIKVVRKLGIEKGLVEAKFWVEKNFPNQGSTS